MKILQLYNRVPFPINSGGSMAVYAMSKGFTEAGCSVKMLAMNTLRHYVEIDSLPQSFKHFTNIEAVTVDNRLKITDAFFNLFSNQSYHIIRFISEDYNKALIQLLQQETFDIIQLEGLFVLPYIETIKQYSKAKIIYRAHNVEFEIWEKLAQQTFGIKKWYLQLLTNRLKKFEVNNLNSCDAITAITFNDAEKLKALGCKKPVHISPFGIAIDDYETEPVKNKKSVFHIGSMDWQPNVEGIMWFLKNIWQNVVAPFPDVTFYMAGKYFPESLKKINQKAVMAVGEVPNGISFMNEHNIMVVPLLSGSGIRIKIIEGLALGKTIVATAIAAQGIEYTHEKNILIANTPQEFIFHIQQCLKNDELCQKIGINARNLAIEKYDNKKIINELLQFYTRL